jgi:catechol 2,3-dioxygenase-like lactoylglutathione lyase family enzyme
MDISDTPSAWVGHISQQVSSPRATVDFYVGLGLREVLTQDTFGIIELAGGTHIVFGEGDIESGSDAPFDLMVADIEQTHAAWSTAGASVSEIADGSVHRSFKLTDPDGVQVRVCDSHVIGAV